MAIELAVFGVMLVAAFLVFLFLAAVGKSDDFLVMSS
jgi:hypothetical protein